MVSIGGLPSEALASYAEALGPLELAPHVVLVQRVG